MNRSARVFLPVGALALFVSELLLITTAFLAATFLIHNVDPVVFLLADNGLLRLAVAVGSILFGLYFEDLYNQIRVRSRVLLIQQLSLVIGIALVIQGLIGYTFDGFRLPLRLMVPACSVLILALFAWRIAFGVVVLRVVGPQRILLVGMCPVLEEMARYIAVHPDLGLEVIGYAGDPAPAVPPEAGPPLGPLTGLPRIVAAARPDRIIVGLDESQGRMPVADLLQLRYAGYAIEEATAAYEQLCGRVLIRELRPAQLLLSGALQTRAQRKVYQTLGQWLLAAVLTVLSAPLLLLAALLLKFSARGPLLIRQESVGLYGKRFPLFSLSLPRGRDGEGLNRAHRFVDRWRLHALPHFWNVLRGEITFVGPQAERAEFAAVLAEKIPFYSQRYRVKPGITGWAQINTAEQPEDTLRSLEYDFYYLKNPSRGLDAYILVHTLRDLLLSRA